MQNFQSFSSRSWGRGGGWVCGRDEAVHGLPAPHPLPQHRAREEQRVRQPLAGYTDQHWKVRGKIYDPSLTISIALLTANYLPLVNFRC